MTLIEAINKIDVLVPNIYSEEEKVAWLSTLDGMIYRDVILTHEGGEDVTYNGYDDDTPNDQKLLVEAPYEDIYIVWLESKIHYTNAEYVKYNNSVTRYNDIYTDYANEYNRNHMPKGKRIRYY